MIYYVHLKKKYIQQQKNPKQATTNIINWILIVLIKKITLLQLNQTTSNKNQIKTKKTL